MVKVQLKQDKYNYGLASSWLEQDEQLRTMWMHGATLKVIAKALGRSSAAVMTRVSRLGLPRRAHPGRKSHNLDVSLQASLNQHQDGTSERVCLMCLNKFISLGRHNRICSRCKETVEYINNSN